MGIKHTFKDLSGLRFGRLTVRWPSGRHGGRTRWLCSCECGSIRPSIPTDHLVRGNTKSCGCLQREKAARTGAAKKLPNHGAGMNALYARYRIAATQRGLIFGISKKVFVFTILLDCHYCGAKPRKCYVNKSVFCVSNGIDRMNNSKGYEKSNIVPCCSTCNFMKVKMSHDEFIKQCRAVAKFREKI